MFVRWSFFVRLKARKLSQREAALLLCFAFVLDYAARERNHRAIPRGTGAGPPTVGSGRRLYCFRSESVPSMA